MRLRFDLRAKLVRNSRKRRWRSRGERAVPLRWFTGRPNFGDDANPHLFQLLGGNVGIRLAGKSEPHFLGMGSILRQAGPRSVVLGSGFISARDRLSLPRYRRIVAVRGQKTLRDLSLPEGDALLGDPMVLIDLLLERPSGRNSEIGLVPHESNMRQYGKRYSGRFRVIDPRKEPMEVVEEIARCGAVISQSLHGLIVADAMEVPNVWLEPDGMVGGKYKFEDYFTTVSGNTDCLAIADLDGGDPPEAAYDVRRFRFDKRDLLSALREAVLAGVDGP